MSNNIYDILKKMANLDTPKATLTESKKAKPDYIDIDKDGDKTESMKKAAKDKTKSGMAEAVAKVEQQLSEKYMGFKKTVAAVKKGGSAEDPEAVAAAIGRKKYGKEKFQKAAAAGKKLGEDALDFLRSPEGIAKNRADKARAEQNFADRSAKHFAGQVGDQYHQQLLKTMPSYRDEYIDYISQKDVSSPKSVSQVKKELQAKHDPMGGPTNIDYEKIKKNPMATRAGEQGSDWRPFGPGPKDYFDTDKFGRPMKEGEIEESGLQAYLGKKKYGEQGMKALQKAGREGAGKEKMAMIRARHDKMDEDAYNEDMLSPKEKSFAALAEPKDKITYADKIAGAKKDKKTEGNKFSGNLMKARAQGLKKADLDGDGEMEPVHEDMPVAFSPEERATRQQTADIARSLSDKKLGDQSKQRIEKQYDADRSSREKLAKIGQLEKYKIGMPPEDVDYMVQQYEKKKSTMREGWEEMQKYLEKKRGPESKGGEGKKAGTRYGGSAQKDDDDEETDGEGKPVEKKRGRPKGTGGGAKFNFKKPKD